MFSKEINKAAFQAKVNTCVCSRAPKAGDLSTEWASKYKFEIQKLIEHRQWKLHS